MKTTTILKTAILFIAAFCLISIAYTQEQTSGSKNITIIGNSKTRTINCNGETITINGNNHHITVNGFCSQIEVAGNDNVVYLENVSVIKLIGNKNNIKYRINPKSETKVSNIGNGNSVVKTE